MEDCPDKKTLGARIKTLRKSAGFKSAKSFAESAGVSANAYVECEQGRSSLTYANAWKIADALEITLDELGGRAWPPEGSEASHPSPADPARAELVAIYDSCERPAREGILASARSMQAVERGEGREAGPTDALDPPRPSRRAV